jgi:hypothetical protein
MKKTFVLATGLFLRLLSAVYGIAFVSLWTQVEGLVGSRGILPIGEYLELIAKHPDLSAPWRYFQFPTLSWLSSSDAFLHGLCGAGTLLSVAGLFVPFSPLLLFLLWALYLSLTVSGQVFFNFQWDVLLLEVGFLAIFVAPLRLLPARRNHASPSLVSLWLLRWLIFRFMFASGIVKLVSDPVWRDFTALTYHYETQCLPPWTAWYIHQLPQWFHVASCAGMFFVELVVPFFIFFPRLLRVSACLFLILLQLVIMFTGNYTFFNLLAICISIPLIDDASWPRRLREKLLREPAADEVAPAPRSFLRPWPWWSVAPVAVLVVPLSFIPLAQAFHLRLEWPAPLAHVHDRTAPFRIVNYYGLFANMTTERPEIVVEGSNDGKEWKAYEFKYKPGELSRRPHFVAPHQPRLDWQMWFAALLSPRERPWFLRFCVRLLEGSPPVLGLLAENPFPEAPPRYVRAQLYDYHFTTWEEGRRTGNWWKRELKGPYLRPFSLKDIQPPAPPRRP